MKEQGVDMGARPMIFRRLAERPRPSRLDFRIPVEQHA